ncbi:MAG: methionyl-tRNA formyltransferase [Bacteroidota bacterium]
MNKEDLRIIFMGTPEFAVPSLDILLKNKYNIVGVITVPDKPAGRGQKLSESAVKKFAIEKGLAVYQPEKMKDDEFQRIIKEELKPDLQVVVAFRMLPESVWKLPKYGTFNLHSSLLPQYRGAAPINWAVINGDKETGVTTFFIDEKIDTGNIIYQEKTNIGINETAGDVHDRLMNIGSKLVLKTVDSIINNTISPLAQESLVNNALKPAPKLNKDNCKVNWLQDAKIIKDHIHGLSPYPAAWSELYNIETKETIPFKIFKAGNISEIHELKNGTILTDQKNYLKIACSNSFLEIKNIQIAGKKAMEVSEFLRGFRFNEKWVVKY